MTDKKLKDLSEFDALSTSQEEGLDVEIVHPKTGDPLGITIRVAGPDSQRQKEAVQRQVDARLRSRSNQPMTGEDIQANNLRLLASSVISWNSVMVDGEQMECTAENAARLFQRFPFIREQVDAKAGDRAAFLKG